MHYVLYVCIPRSEARSSLQARKQVCKYLLDEGFAQELRFAGHCDYFNVGGRYSGRLNVLRLRDEQPQQFTKFWKRYRKLMPDKDAKAMFRETFPNYRGKLPINRNTVDFIGAADDAQVMDASLFRQLKSGFGSNVTYSYEIAEPNVICMEGTDDFEWPKTAEEAAKLWVVVIDYHSWQ
jgi:hypothetical protein